MSFSPNTIQILSCHQASLFAHKRSSLRQGKVALHPVCFLFAWKGGACAGVHTGNTFYWFFHFHSIFQVQKQHLNFNASTRRSENGNGKRKTWLRGQYYVEILKRTWSLHTFCFCLAPIKANYALVLYQRQTPLKILMDFQRSCWFFSVSTKGYFTLYLLPQNLWIIWSHGLRTH